MALHEKSTGQGLFFSIKHGGFCLEAKEPTEGFKETSVPNPKTQQLMKKYLKIYAGIEGKITKIIWSDRTYDNTRYVSIKLVIEDSGEFYTLEMPFGKQHYNYFMRVMDNIDYTQPVQFEAYPKKGDQGRLYTDFSMKQNGRFLLQSYTKANPGACPVAVKDGLGNWDSKARHIWLRDRLFNYIIPHLEEITASGDNDAPELDTDVIAEREAIADEVLHSNPNEGPDFSPFTPTDDQVPPDNSIPW